MGNITVTMSNQPFWAGYTLSAHLQPVSYLWENDRGITCGIWVLVVHFKFGFRYGLLYVLGKNAEEVIQFAKPN